MKDSIDVIKTLDNRMLKANSTLSEQNNNVINKIREIESNIVV